MLAPSQLADPMMSEMSVLEKRCVWNFSGKSREQSQYKSLGIFSKKGHIIFNDQLYIFYLFFLPIQNFYFKRNLHGKVVNIIVPRSY